MSYDDAGSALKCAFNDLPLWGSRNPNSVRSATEYNDDAGVESFDLSLQEIPTAGIAGWSKLRLSWTLDGVCVEQRFPIHASLMKRFE
jgi:hypothetical protein